MYNQNRKKKSGDSGSVLSINLFLGSNEDRFVRKIDAKRANRTMDNISNTSILYSTFEDSQKCYEEDSLLAQQDTINNIFSGGSIERDFSLLSAVSRGSPRKKEGLLFRAFSGWKLLVRRLSRGKKILEKLTRLKLKRWMFGYFFRWKKESFFIGIQEKKQNFSPVKPYSLKVQTQNFGLTRFFKKLKAYKVINQKKRQAKNFHYFHLLFKAIKSWIMAMSQRKMACARRAPNHQSDPMFTFSNRGGINALPCFFNNKEPVSQELTKLRPGTLTLEIGNRAELYYQAILIEKALKGLKKYAKNRERRKKLWKVGNLIIKKRFVRGPFNHWLNLFEFRKKRAEVFYLLMAKLKKKNLGSCLIKLKDFSKLKQVREKLKETIKIFTKNPARQRGKSFIGKENKPPSELKKEQTITSNESFRKGPSDNKTINSSSFYLKLRRDISKEIEEKIFSNKSVLDGKVQVEKITKSPTVNFSSHYQCYINQIGFRKQTSQTKVQSRRLLNKSCDQGQEDRKACYKEAGLEKSFHIPKKEKIIQADLTDLEAYMMKLRVELEKERTFQKELLEIQKRL